RPKAGAACGRTAGAPQDEVLAVVARSDQRESGQRASGDEECPEGDWKLLPKSAHTKDVVLVVQRFDDDAGCQEQQGFEERVRHEVEDGGAPCTNAQRQKHITDLAYGGIREDALDVVLRQRA